MVMPPRLTGRRWTRGSPVGGASTSSSSVTPNVLARGSSSSSVGRRAPDSRRDSVLTEMPVAAQSSASVISCRCRRVRSRGPAAAIVSSRSSTPLVCHNGKDICQVSRIGCTVDGMDNIFDVVVIGGGAAGLNGALMLARSRRSVLVVDAGQPRNAPASGVHGLLGRDGMPPQELLELGRAEVRSYGGAVVTGDVVRLARTGHLFTVELSDGRRTTARRLLITSGLVDELPAVAGLGDRWGRDVIHCPYCHGWEVRDQSIGVLATGPMAVHQALLFRQLTSVVVLFTHTGPALSDEQVQQLAARAIRVIDGRVVGLVVTDDHLTGI